MAEMGRPVGYADADPELHSAVVVESSTPVPGGGLTFFETVGNNWFRPRYVNVFGTVAGTVGSVTVGIEAVSTLAAPSPFDQGMLWEARADLPVPINKAFNFTWSADIGDNYTGPSSAFDFAGVFGMPLVYMPSGCLMHVLATASAGGDGTVTVDGGMLQYELFQTAGRGQGNARADLYLLPALG